MNCSFDTIVAGAGLAGTCAAWVLSGSERVLLLDERAAGSGASSTPMGVVSPLMARRARAVWRVEEALAALEGLLDEAGLSSLFQAGGVLKPADDEAQALEFADAAHTWPQHGVWFGPEEAAELWPALRSPFGVLRVSTGGAIDMPSFCRNLADAAVRERGAEYLNDCRLTGWTAKADSVDAWIQSTSSDGGPGHVVSARRLLMATGAGYHAFASTGKLDLHPIKGQWIRLGGLDSTAWTTGSLSELPPVSAARYVVRQDDSFVVGGTYQHRFSNLKPDAGISEELRETAASLVPGLAEAELLAAGSALRITVPGVRLPMVGPIPESARVWIFTGLGSKGLLMAPLVARLLPDFFTGSREIPKELCVTLR